MSFFDDDDDEPIRASRTRPARPRTAAAGTGGSRVAPGGPGGGSRGGGGGASAATVRQRQLVLGAAALVALILLVLLISSCQSSKKERALKDYNRSVTQIATDSDKVGADFFSVLDGAGSGGNDVQVRVNQLRLTADELVKRARALEPRDEMRRAQDDLELVLNLRGQGLRKIADKLPTALVSGRDRAQSVETALTQIAGQMQQFLASDVVYSQRVAPYIREALASADVQGQRVSLSRFLPSLAWLNPNSVADRLGAQRAEGGIGANPKPAPGLHGHALTSVSVGSVTLQPGTAANRVPARPVPPFTVKLSNGGEFDERDVTVNLRVAVAGEKAIVRKTTIGLTKKKSDATVTIPLGAPAPTRTATVTVAIATVPGEKKVDNNRQTYTVVFPQ